MVSIIKHWTLRHSNNNNCHLSDDMNTVLNWKIPRFRLEWMHPHHHDFKMCVIVCYLVLGWFLSISMAACTYSDMYFGLTLDHFGLPLGWSTTTLGCLLVDFKVMLGWYNTSLDWLWVTLGRLCDFWCFGLLCVVWVF